jgi:hypothetical protein
MQSNYCFDLTIPVLHPLKDPSILNQTGDSAEIWFTEHSNVSDEFTTWLDDLDLVMTYPPLIFYTPKGKQCGIHIDGSGQLLDRACMNWCVQGSGSLMHWYTIKNNQTPFENTTTQAGTPYVQYHPSQVNHVHSQSVNWPSIVQTGMPHNIHNSTFEPRWVLSCDISFKSAPESGMTMAQALQTFKKWIISNK